MVRLGTRPIETGKFVDCRQFIVRNEMPAAVATDFSTGSVLILYNESVITSRNKPANQLFILASNCLFEPSLRVIDPIRMCPLISEVVCIDFTRDKTHLLCVGKSSRQALEQKYINYEIAVQYFRSSQFSQIGTLALNDELTRDDFVLLQTFTVHPELFLVAFPELMCLFRLEPEDSGRLGIYKIRMFRPPGECTS